VFLMHSDGGIISIESAADFPVRLVESGPCRGRDTTLKTARVLEVTALQRIATRRLCAAV